MKAMIAVLVVAAVFCCASGGYAVPPTYEGQFGNPEEPALRVIKWPWLGFRKFVVSTHEGLQSGSEKESLVATGREGAAGAWAGAKIMADHTARGMVYAPLPPKAPLGKTVSYEEKAMAFIEAVNAPKSEGAEGAPSAPSEVVDGEEKKEEPKYLESKVKESEVEKAQRRYVPDRVAARDRTPKTSGNLLKLAR